jgi:hypothetical protein
MKTICSIVLFTFILQSCSNKENNTDLFGYWISINSANTVELKIYEDSLIYNSWEKSTKFSWKSDSSRIYYTQLTNIDPELETHFIMEYRINAEKDTLFFKNSNSAFTTKFIKKVD